MEPFSLVLLSTGAAAMYAAHRAEAKVGKAAKGLKTLPDILDQSKVHGNALVPVVVVHVRRLELPPHLIGQGVKVFVKYGAIGDRACCDAGCTRAAQAPPSAAARFVARIDKRPRRQRASADVGALCLFKACGALRPKVWIHVARPGFKGTVARADFTWLPVEGVEEREVPLYAPGVLDKTEVGRVDVALELHVLSKSALQAVLQQLPAEQQPQAFLARALPLVVGSLEEGEPEARAELLQGQAVAPAAAGPQRPGS